MEVIRLVVQQGHRGPDSEGHRAAREWGCRRPCGEGGKAEAGRMGLGCTYD